MQTFSIIIPAFNEEKRLGTTLSMITDASKNGLFAPFDLTEVIVANDGSTDQTVQIAHQYKDTLQLRVVSLEKNYGKGAAVRAGMLAASSDFFLMYDADGATPVTEIPKLFRAIEAGADIAIGSRVIGSAEGIRSMSPHRRFIGRVYRLLCSSLVPNIHDAACGCKLFRSSAAQKIFREQTINRFAFDIEILAIALDSGLKIAEVPVFWTEMPESKVRLFTDGPEMFFSLLRLYLRPRAHNTSKESE